MKGQQLIKERLKCSKFSTENILRKSRGQIKTCEVYERPFLNKKTYMNVHYYLILN